MGGSWCIRAPVCFELHLGHTPAEHPVSHSTWQVPLNITTVKINHPRWGQRVHGSTDYSSFPTEITKIEMLVKTVAFTAMHFIGLPSSMNFPRRDCYFQSSRTQPIEMGESWNILLRAQVSPSPIDPEPRFAQWKPRQSCWGISSCHGSDLSVLWPLQNSPQLLDSLLQKLAAAHQAPQNCPGSMQKFWNSLACS